MATLLKHTVAPSGGDYTSLSAAIAHLAAAHADLVGNDQYAEIEISGDWSGGADTTAVNVNGMTTDATRYIHIYTDASNRASASWSATKYALSLTNATALTISDDYVRIDGLQISVASVNAANQQCINSAAGISATNNDIRLSCLLVKGADDDTNVQHGIYFVDTDINCSIWNCVVYNIGGDSDTYSSCITIGGATNKIYSTTCIGGFRGISCSAGSTTLKNCYAGGSFSEDISYVGGTLAKTNCMTEDASADDTGANETATNCTNSIALDADTFVNVGAGTEDYHLAADGLSPLQGAGVNTSGDSAPMNFTTDIDGDARDSTWDIGADAAVSVATNVVMNII